RISAPALERVVMRCVRGLRWFVPRGAYCRLTQEAARCPAKPAAVSRIRVNQWWRRTAIVSFVVTLICGVAVINDARVASATTQPPIWGQVPDGSLDVVHNDYKAGVALRDGS